VNDPLAPAKPSQDF
jgi:hypothetical protein